MAKSRVKTWAAEVLTHTDLNAEFDNLINTPMDLISPATANLDMNAYTIILDADQDTTLGAGTDDVATMTVGGAILCHFRNGSIDLNTNRLDFSNDGDSSIRQSADDIVRLELQGFDAVIFDGDVSNPVNGLQITTAATGNPCAIAPQGEAGAALSLDLNGGPLIVDVDGDAIIEAVDNDDVMDFKIQSFDAVRIDGSVTSPVNGMTLGAAATGVDATITAHGETNTGINLVPTGTGTIKIDGGILAGKCLEGSTTWDPDNVGSTAGQTSDTTTCTVTGAVPGDYVMVSQSGSWTRGSLSGVVTSSDTVVITLENTGGDINYGSRTFYCRVFTRA